MKRIFTFVIVITLVFATLTGCSSSNNDLYSAKNTDIRLMYLLDDYGAMPSNVRDPYAITNIYPNPEDYSVYSGEEIEIVKNQLTEFFEEKYNVSVEDKLDLIETRIFCDSSNTNGYSVPGESIIYLNQNILDGSLKAFANTWAHEAIHDLGLKYFNNSYNGLYETITEAVNQQFLDWAGYENVESMYSTVVPVGTMLITINPDLVVKSITDENFLIEEEIDKVLSNTTYTQEIVPDGHSVSFQLSQYLFNFYYNYYELDNNSFYVAVQGIKEITVAYCRTFELSEEQINAFKDIWTSGTYNRIIF